MALELQAGARVREYEILDLVGRGGMGAVYKARHIYLDKIRAIKFIHSTLAVDPDFVERFIREARVLSELNHPNLVRLYEFGTLEQNTFFMVLEFVHGESLLNRIRRKERLSLEEAVPIVRDAALGLQSAHELGIVHRDISPDNLLLVRTHDGAEATKVIDFGIAKPLLETQQVTTTTFFLGKPEYCSPEQTGMLREGETIDHRSDIYSLAVTFYHAISGKLPFYSPTPQGYLLKHAMEEPQSILTHFAPGEVPQELDRFLRKSLAKRRDDRFSSMKDFVDELDHVARVLKEVQRTVALADPQRNFQEFFDRGKAYLDQLDYEEAIRWWNRALVISPEPSVQQWVAAAEERRHVENEIRTQIARDLEDCEIQLSRANLQGANLLLNRAETSIAPGFRLGDLQTQVASLRQRMGQRQFAPQRSPAPPAKRSGSWVLPVVLVILLLTGLIGAIAVWKWQQYEKAEKGRQIVHDMEQLETQDRFSEARQKLSELQLLGIYSGNPMYDEAASQLQSREMEYARSRLQDAVAAQQAGNIPLAESKLAELRTLGVAGFEEQIASLEEQIKQAKTSGQNPQQLSDAEYLKRAEQSRTPLMWALFNQNTAEAQSLLQQNADPDGVDANGFSVLMYAVWRSPSLVRDILDRGASVFRSDNRRVTALHVAADVGQVEATSALISAGADINARNSQGSTPLIVAAIQGHIGVAKLLIDSGADLSITTPNGYDALRTAEYYNRSEIAEMIRNAQAQKN